MTKVSKRLYAEVLRLDDYTCVYCGVRSTQLAVDHLIPRSLGGADLLPNLAAACKSCNSKKGDRPLYVARMFPMYGRYAYVTGLPAMPSPAPVIPKPVTPPIDADTLPELSARDLQVRQLVQERVPQSQIIRRVWGVTSGHAYQLAGKELTKTMQRLVVHADIRRARNLSFEETVSQELLQQLETDPALQVARAAGVHMIGMAEVPGGYLFQVDRP